MFISIVSRPDIAFSVNYLSRFLNYYNESHWQAAKRVVSYLKGTCDLIVCYSGNELVLSVYCDSDYATDPELRGPPQVLFFGLVVVQ